MPTSHPRTRQKTLLHLRILATTDLHANLMPYDYYSDTPIETTGLVRTASLIRMARSEVANTLLFDNGDVIQGSALGDYMAKGAQDADTPIHPIIQAMNALGYDAGTLGNHEFSHGLPVLEGQLHHMAYPVVSANMLRRKGVTPMEDVHLVAPYAVLDRDFVDASGQRHCLRIGVVGVAPPQVLTWDHAHVTGRLQVRDMTQAVAAAVQQLRLAGSDLVVVLGHTGLGCMPAVEGDENAGMALAALPGVDVLVMGHAHQVFPSLAFAGLAGVELAKGQVLGKPAVMAGMFGSHLGVIDLTLARSKARWQIVASQSEVRPIASRDGRGLAVALVPDDPQMLAIASPAHARVQAWMNQPIGHNLIPLHSYFALVCDSAMLRVVAHAQSLHLQGLLTDTAHAHLPILSAVAPFKAGGRVGPDNFTDIPAGPLSLRHAADLYIHPNTFAALLMTGADVSEWLERAAAIFHQIPTGAREGGLINPAIPAFAMEMISGVTYTIDLTSAARYDAKGALCDPSARRISNLCYQGQPIDPAMPFALATNSYRASVYSVQSPQPVQVLVEGSDTMREIIVTHVARKPSLPAPPPACWHFAPMPGTTVTFDSSPRAISHLADIAQFRPEPLGLTAEGFQRFRLHL